MLKTIRFALLSCITALFCFSVSAQTQPDVCKDAPSQADWNSATSPVYADATALAEELKSHGVAVECIRPSKQENIFEGQKGAAWFQSNHLLLQRKSPSHAQIHADRQTSPFHQT
jgi:hypothetical protein